MAFGKITISTSEYRPCYVEGKKALFHKWNDVAEVQAAGFAIGSSPGGQLKATFGLVEFEDGTVKEVLPHKIKFADKKINEYYFDEEVIQSEQKASN